jgi:hypothetical protein
MTCILMYGILCRCLAIHVIYIFADVKKLKECVRREFRIWQPQPKEKKRDFLSISVTEVRCHNMKLRFQNEIAQPKIQTCIFFF